MKIRLLIICFALFVGMLVIAQAANIVRWTITTEVSMAYVPSAPTLTITPLTSSSARFDIANPNPPGATDFILYHIVGTATNALATNTTNFVQSSGIVAGRTNGWFVVVTGK